MNLIEYNNTSTPNLAHCISIYYYYYIYFETHTYTCTHTHTHTPSGGGIDVFRYFNFSLAASISILICSRALTTSLHDAVMVVSSQYCSMYILQCSTTPSCSMLILSNACTGTFKYAPRIHQSVISLSSSNSTATVSSGVSTHR